VTSLPLWFVGALAFVLGGFAHRIYLDRERDTSSLCPTCLGPLDDEGMSEAWSARLEPAEGQVVVDPEDDGRGFLLLDDGRVGRVDVVPAETMLLAEDAPPFAPEPDVEESGRDA